VFINRRLRSTLPRCGTVVIKPMRRAFILGNETISDARTRDVKAA